MNLATIRCSLVDPGSTLVETTVGRAVLSKILPKGMEYSQINRVMTKKVISKVLDGCYRNYGLKAAVIFADQLMYTGFKYATRGGASIGVNDMEIPSG